MVSDRTRAEPIVASRGNPFRTLRAMNEQLDERQIDDFLRSQVVGRIGVHADGETYVVPIIYAWDGDCIYVQSIEGRKIAMMRASPEVCFEVDEYDAGSWRSVIVDGTYEELTGDDAAHALELLVAKFARPGGDSRRRPSAEGRTPVAFRIRPTRMTGRAVTR
jgi:nitroimidazol reductase NimA-like FMN-containing flavoprotein (pyridoxamine 5'-phosphate oxidase superfamily)